MRLVCPNCSAKYEVDVSLFPEEGREVQCANCEHAWMQYPEAEEQPMRLDPIAVVTEEVRGTRPSDRLSADERDALQSAVRREVKLRDTDPPLTAPAAQPQEEDLSEDQILSALRQQIQAEGGDFEKDKGSEGQSQRRNLRKAAEAAGIDVDAKEEVRSRWNFSGEKGNDNSPARSKLAEALRDYEEMAPRRRGGMRMGFIAALVLLGIGAGVYAMKDQITEAVPQAGPYLDTYAGLVDQGRDTAEGLWAEYGVMVMAKISEMTEGGEEAPAN